MAARRPLGQGRRLSPDGASLRDRSIGIVGLGRIGKAIARRCEAFGLPISLSGRHKPGRRRATASTPIWCHGARCRHADRHHARRPWHHKLINAAVFEALGPRGILINVVARLGGGRGSADRRLEEAARSWRRPRRVCRASPTSIRRSLTLDNVSCCRTSAPLPCNARCHGPAGGRQPGRLRRGQAPADSRAGNTLQGLVKSSMAWNFLLVNMNLPRTSALDVSGRRHRIRSCAISTLFRTRNPPFSNRRPARAGDRSLCCRSAPSQLCSGRERPISPPAHGAMRWTPSCSGRSDSPIFGSAIHHLAESWLPTAIRPSRSALPGMFVRGRRLCIWPDERHTRSCKLRCNHGNCHRA